MNSSFWRLLQYLRNYKTNVALNMISNVLTAVFTALSIPLLIPFLNILFEREELVLHKPEFSYSVDYLTTSAKFFISQMVVEDKYNALIWVCGALVLVFLLKNLFRYLSLFFMAPVRNGIVRDLRKQLFTKILALPIAYFSDEKKGDLMSRMTADVQEVESSILNVLESIFREPLILLSSLGFMLLMSPELTLFVFGLIFFVAVVIGGVGRSLKKTSTAVQEKLGALLSVVEESLSGLRIIKSFNSQTYIHDKFDHENDGYMHLLTKLLRRRDLASPLSEFLGIFTVVILLWYGASLVFSGKMEPASFLTFIIAFYYLIDPAKKLSKASYNVQKGIGALNRINEILDTPLDIVDAPNAQPIHELKKGILYNKVSFAYKNSETNVLSNIQLEIKKGKTIALVGASGAGKSTIADLLPRFYDVTQGSIEIDGIDIRQYKTQDLRQLMGVVSQEAILFNDTIYNNIAFGQECTAEQVEQAAKMANAHEFIINTEQGYHTNIGERGSKLSGGQRQRITIARALLKNPPILVLDEATSALDSESEQLVQQALTNLMANKTSIVIAHRLSTIRYADEIIVLDQGQIIERGSHEELLAKDGDYKRLLQFQGLL